MLTDVLLEFFTRDLQKLREEIGLYREEEALWTVRGEIANTAGNLCLHLVGNLNHFIGATLGQTGYVRQRELEFSRKNVPRGELLAAIDDTIRVVENTLQQLDGHALERDFPLEKHGRTVSVEHMLLHLFGHLNYHLGQVNYHRRLLDEAAG